MKLLRQHPELFDPATPWIQEGESIRQDSRLFRQVVATRRSPHTGREHAFYRLQGPDWVNVIPFTEDGDLLVVEQFRHGIDAPTLEIPGGSCDEGETPLESARRELREETGFEAREWTGLGQCAPNPATLGNHCHTFLALGCQAVSGLALDPSEELRLWACPWTEWAELLRSGRIEHALVLTAFFKLDRWTGWPALRHELEAR
ncbi:MAG TPA: NUDIX hydrolase [Holophagaceae bacterium]|jgi:ADP-ribose pyrophosphatase|nr:NUDIX hydrolase [Holophagaceae bacterium]